MVEKVATGVALVLVMLCGAAPGALGAQGNVNFIGPVSFRAASDDGARVVLATQTALVAADTDAEVDVYAVQGAVPELLSVGPAGGNAPLRPATFEAASPDAARVFFTTREALVAADGDTTKDIYVHANGQAQLLTSAESDFRGLSKDGEHVYFTTAVALDAADTDSATDLYEHAGGAVSLVSVGPGGANVTASDFVGSSANGDVVWFETRDPVVAADDDAGAIDVYERSGGTTRLVTSWPAAAGGASDARFADASADGARVFVTTSGQVTPADLDASADVFVVTAGGTELISTGPADPAPGGQSAATLRDASPDGTRVLFHSPAALVAGRPGNSVYERAAGVTTWLGPVTSFRYSGDSSAAWVVTSGGLVPEDVDAQDDIYLRAGGTTTLVSAGFSAPGASLTGTSHDGARLFFTTNSALDPLDTDAAWDLYALWNGVVYLMSTGPTSWPTVPPEGPVAAANTPSGDLVFFTFLDRLTADDADTEPDVYAARFPDTSGFARPGGASPLRVPLVPAYERCTSPNRTHGPSLAFGSCAPPVRSPSRLTVGTPDANGRPAQSVAGVRLTTLPGDPATPADEADVRIELHDTDVREAQDLTDYPGELELSLRIRITDRDGQDGPAVPVTEEDAELSITALCAPTPGTAGSTCSVDTTADAVIPGAVGEARRTIWGQDAVRVFDGGADGDAGTLADNRLFQTQGIFIP